MQQDFEQNTTQDVSEGKTTRRSRSTDSRSFDSRAANERAPLNYGTLSRFNVPEKTRKKYKDMGYDLCWIMYSSGNLEQKENYFKALERGYSPVLASDDPELCRNYSMSPFGEKSDSNIDSFIPRGGQILMKIKEEERESELELYDSENRRNNYMTNMHKIAANNPGAPRPFIDERRRERVH